MLQTVTRIQCGNDNCYLLSKGKDAVLIDTGREDCREKVLAACLPFDVRLILLTHGHIDHVQNAAFLAAHLQVPIGMSREDADLIKDNMAQPLGCRGILGRLVLAASLRSFRRDKIPEFVPSVFFEDGDTLEEYGVEAGIVSLPGHTRGSLGVDAAGGSFIAGDALMNMAWPSLSLLYYDKDAMLRSAEKISRLPERTIYFGHGRPVKNREWK